MNVVITLPRDLINKIINGEKWYEMRRSFPYRCRDGNGVFVIEKGTDRVRCFFRVLDFISIEPYEARACAARLGVSVEYVNNYCKNTKRVYLWKIGRVTALSNCRRSNLGVKRNPLNFVYTNVRLI